MGCLGFGKQRNRSVRCTATDCVARFLFVILALVPVTLLVPGRRLEWVRLLREGCRRPEHKNEGQPEGYEPASCASWLQKDRIPERGGVEPGCPARKAFLLWSRHAARQERRRAREHRIHASGITETWMG